MWLVFAVVARWRVASDPTRDLVACGSATDAASRESAARCVSARSDAAFAFGMTPRAAVRHDGCEYTSFDACASSGVSVVPYCTCADHWQQGYAWCCTTGTCPGATASGFFPGAALRECAAPSPPPPATEACADPLFVAQWHHAVLRSTDAWTRTRGGNAMVVVVDDGVQYAHPDLHVDAARSFGWDGTTQSPTLSADVGPVGTTVGAHGTACAGVAAGVAHNGVGGCGVASGATLVAVRLLTSDYEMSDAGLNHTLSQFAVDAAVVSNSWGPPDDGFVDGPGIWPAAYARVDAALERFGRDGREGRGGLLVFAAGNGGVHDNANDDGFVSHRRTIAVGSVGDDGRAPVYAERGACVDVVAPSSGGVRAVVTTDLVAPGGYVNDSDATLAFSGTSASAPMVGVLALMVSVRPDLTAREARRVLHDTARHTHAGEWVVNAAGRAHSPWYGFGVVDAAAAVARAVVAPPLPPAAESCAYGWTGNVALASTVTAVDLGAPERGFEVVEEVRVHVDVAHSWRGDVLVFVVSRAARASSGVARAARVHTHRARTLPMARGVRAARRHAALGFLGERADASERWSLEVRCSTARAACVRRSCA